MNDNVLANPLLPCCRPIVSCTDISESYFIIKCLRSAIFSARRTVAGKFVARWKIVDRGAERSAGKICGAWRRARFGIIFGFGLGAFARNARTSAASRLLHRKSIARPRNSHRHGRPASQRDQASPSAHFFRRPCGVVLFDFRGHPGRRPRATLVPRAI